MSKKSKRTDPTSGLRDNAMMAAAAAGHTQQEIAKEFGVHRTAVARVLKSSEAKELVAQGRAQLISHITLAVETLVTAMEDRASNMGVAVQAAIQLLKGVGALTEQSQVTIMKPFIYEKPDGGEIVMGHKPLTDEEEKDYGEED